LFGAFLLPAEPVHSLLPGPGRFKMSDGYLLRWNANPTDPDRDAIEAFDRYGARVFGLNIYQLLPPASTVSIHDVAVRRGQSIAIAAVTREKDGGTFARLLRLTWDGHLTNMTQLDAANEIGWLDFDEAGNIWGLTNYLGERIRKDTIADGIPCPLGPLILVFNPEGRVIKSLLKQADFPDSLREGSNIGQVAFGLTGGNVWFWQPATHRMIVTDRNGGGIQKISIRHASSRNLGGPALLTRRGEVIQDLHSITPGVRGIYRVHHRRTKRFGQPQGAFLVGIDGAEFVFLRQTNSADFLMIRVKSLAEWKEMATVIPSTQEVAAR